jgi:thymidylate kinase
MTVYYVDGPDGTGKTGYSRYLSDYTGYPRLEMRPVDSTDDIEGKSAVFNAVIRDLYDQGTDLVVDRGSTSSIVYSRVFDRGKPEHAWETLNHVEPVVFYLRCNPDELAVRYGNNDELFSPDEIRAVAATYDDVMSEVQDSTPVDVVEIDTTVSVTEKLEKAVFGEGVDDRRTADCV